MDNAEKLGQQSGKLVAVGFFLVLLVLAGLLLLRLWNLADEKHRNTLLADTTEEQALVYEMAGIARSSLKLQEELLLLKNRQEAILNMKAHDSLAESFRSKLKKLSPLIETPSVNRTPLYDKSKELDEWMKLQTLIGQAKEIQDNLYQIIHAEKWDETPSQIERANQIHYEVIDGLTNIYTESTAHLKRLAVENASSILRQTFLANILGSIAILTGVAIAYYVRKTILRTEGRMLKAMNEAIIANQYKSTFLANITHDLKSPLNAMMGYSQLLRMQISALGRPELLKDIDKIEYGGRHLLELINNLLDLAKIESGKMTLYIEALDIPTWLPQIMDIAKPLVAKNGNTLSVTVNDDVSEIKADSTKLMEILINLLGNASKFTEQGDVSLVVSKIKKEGVPHYQFRIRDTGIGMTEEQMKYVFDPFLQAEPSTTRKHGGTGLGLAICKCFTEMMGGMLTVESQLGKGSEFTLTLPVEVKQAC